MKDSKHIYGLPSVYTHSYSYVLLVFEHTTPDSSVGQLDKYNNQISRCIELASWSGPILQAEEDYSHILRCHSNKQRPAFAVHEVGAAERRSPEAAPSFCCA